VQALVFVLTENVRAQGDAELRKLLTAVRAEQVEQHMYPQWGRRSLPSLPLDLEEHNEFVENAVRIVDKIYNSKRIKIDTDGTAGLVTQTQVALVHIPSIGIDGKKRSRYCKM